MSECDFCTDDEQCINCRVQAKALIAAYSGIPSHLQADLYHSMFYEPEQKVRVPKQDLGPFYVYVLESINWPNHSAGGTYTGHTNNLEMRLTFHNRGEAGSRTTKKYRPYRIAGVISGLKTRPMAQQLEMAAKHYKRGDLKQSYEHLPKTWTYAQKKVWKLSRFLNLVRKLQPEGITMDIFIKMPTDPHEEIRHATVQGRLKRAQKDDLRLSRMTMQQIEEQRAKITKKLARPSAANK